MFKTAFYSETGSADTQFHDFT